MKKKLRNHNPKRSKNKNVPLPKYLGIERIAFMDMGKLYANMYANMWFISYPILLIAQGLEKSKKDLESL